MALKYVRFLESVLTSHPPPTKTEILDVAPSVDYLARESIFVGDINAAWQMVDDILKCNVTLLAIDTEYAYRNKKVLKVKSNGAPLKEWHDIRSIRPLLLSLAAIVQKALLVYVVDLRIPGIAEPVQKVLSSGLKVACHYVKSEFNCLKTLGVSLPDSVFDTHVVAIALNLGKFHYKYLKTNLETDKDVEEGQRLSERKKVSNSSLIGLCKRFGVAYQFESSKRRLQKSFDKMTDNDEFTKEQVEYSAEDSIAVAKLYYPLCQELIKNDLLTHVEKIEFPYAIVNAQSEYHGFRISNEKCDLVVQGLKKSVVGTLKWFRDFSRPVINPNSSKEIKALFSDLGILRYFEVKTNKTGYSFKRELLEESRRVHEVVERLYYYRKQSYQLSNRLFYGDFVSVDGRVHANLVQLGADTGRTTSRDPSINSIGKIFRPIVIPGEGCLIGEVDLSQIEMGLAAALSGDERLINDYNTGDIYVAAAKRFYGLRLTNEQLGYTVKEFKRDPRTNALRNIMKVFCLGVIYNMSPVGVAKALGIPISQAALEIERFFNLYPTLKAYMEGLEVYGRCRGYARSIAGLRRYRARPEFAPTPWEVNWLRNMPIQSSASDLFKLIVIALDKEYRKWNAKTILQVYDAVVFESPAKHLNAVARRTKMIMEKQVSEMFPALKGKADVNISQPHCWNKDGRWDSIEEFLKNPNYRL